MSNEIIDAHFLELERRLRLTKRQRKIAVERCGSVGAQLHKTYYGTKYDGSTKLLIGSFGKNTAIRPLNDVDMIFKIPAEIFARFQAHSGNGSADLLQDVRNALQSKYPLTEKRGWVKVVALEFETSPRIEILPACEQADGTFIIPNSADGGKWEKYDARTGLKNITNAPKRVRQLIKFIKHWRDGISAEISSYFIECAILDFANSEEFVDDWLGATKNFFARLTEADDSIVSAPAETAKKRIGKAIEYANLGDYQNACSELRKVFNKFPNYNSGYFNIAKLSKQYPSDAEQYVEDYAEVDIKEEATLHIMTVVTATAKGWSHAPYTLQEIISKFGKIPPQFKIRFLPRTNYEGEVTYKWKIRNFGEEAKSANNLRGEITDGDMGDGHLVEFTRYAGHYHYVECYMIENGICIARKMLFVPIGGIHE